MAAEVNDTASDSAADSGDHNDTVGQGDGDVAEIDISDTADTVLPTDTTTTDCPCGDGICGTSCGETEATCPADCKGCGNGVCEPGEGPKACAIDCCGACGDGKGKGYDCKVLLVWLAERLQQEAGLVTLMGAGTVVEHH